MLFKAEKIDWRIGLVVFLFAAVFGLVFALQPRAKRDDLLAQISGALSTPAPTPRPMPTEINANFLAQVTDCFIPVASVYGYTLRITSGFRSIGEQNQLYEQGRTVDGHIVSWASEGKSIHNYGFAVDVVDRWRGYNIDWKKIAKIGAYCGLAQVDDPHFEYRGGLSTEDFIEGKTPPPLALPCSIMGDRAGAGKPLTAEDLKKCGAPKF